MRKGTALLAVAAIFLAGALVGVLATQAFWAWQIHRPGGLAALGVRILSARLDRQLDLTPDQRRQVDAILSDTRGELQQVRHESVPRLFAIRDRAFSRIDAVLTPAQRQRLAHFRERNTRNLERLFGNW